MKISELKDFLIEHYFKNRDISILLLGPPGIGKSMTVREVASIIAEKLGRTFVEYDDYIADEVLKSPEKYFVLVDIRLTEHEPSDLSGIPREENRYIVFKPLKWAYVLSRTAGLLFLDEVTNVQRDDMKAVMYKLFLDRRVGYVKLSSDVMIVGAGNDPEYSSIANYLPAPLINRCTVISVDSPTVDEWSSYIYSKYGNSVKISRIVGFLRRHPEYLLMPPKQVDTLENYPTPRSWEMFLRFYLADMYSLDVAVGCLGEYVGKMVFKYLEKTVPSLEELFKSPQIFKSLDEEARFIICSELADYLTSNDVDDKIINLFRIIQECSNEYIMFILSMIPDRIDKRVNVRKARLILRLAREIKMLQNLQKEYEELVKSLERE